MKGLLKKGHGYWSTSDHFKTKEMCEKAVEACLWSLEYVPDNLKTQGMCKKAVEKDPRMVMHVPDHFKVGFVCS